MKKKLAITFSLLAATTALTPAITAVTAQTSTLDEIIIKKDNIDLSISKDLFNQAIAARLLKSTDISAIGLSNSNYYLKNHFNEAVLMQGSINQALNFLNESNLQITISPIDATFENNELVPATFKVLNIE